MQPETADIQNRKRRFIIVKKGPKRGMERFDEYIQKSGLEPKSYQRDGVAFCLRREERGAGGAGGAAIVGNGNISWAAFGTRIGSIS